MDPSKEINIITRAAAAFERVGNASVARELRSLPAAAPQVVANERALPPLPKCKTLSGKDLDSLQTFFSEEQMREYARAALAEAKASIPEIPDNCTLATTQEIRAAAPVQPVAVPDGSREAFEKCLYSFGQRIAQDVYKDAMGRTVDISGDKTRFIVKAIMADIVGSGLIEDLITAAPAAQGDAMQSVLTFSPTQEQFKEWCDRYGMQENVSHEAFYDAASLYLLDIAVKAAS